MRPLERNITHSVHPRRAIEASRRMIYQAFREGRVSEDEATAELLAINLLERQEGQSSIPDARAPRLA